MREKILTEVRHVVEFLAAKKFDAIESLTKGVRLSSSAIRDAVEEYGRELIVPPRAAYDLIDIVEVKNSSPAKWSVVMPLWTKEEGRSDLSIELTLISHRDGFVVEVDDIHVL